MLVGVVEGVLGTVELDLTGDERIESIAAGRPVRNREVVFMLTGSIRIDQIGYLLTPVEVGLQPR